MQKGFDLGRSPPVLNFLEYPPGYGHPSTHTLDEEIGEDLKIVQTKSCQLVLQKEDQVKKIRSKKPGRTTFGFDNRSY